MSTTSSMATLAPNSPGGAPALSPPQPQQQQQVVGTGAGTSTPVAVAGSGASAVAGGVATAMAAAAGAAGAAGASATGAAGATGAGRAAGTTGARTTAVGGSDTSAAAAAAATAAAAAAAVSGSTTSAGRIAGKTPSSLLGSPLIGGIGLSTPLPASIAEGAEDPVGRLPPLSGGVAVATGAGAGGSGGGSGGGAGGGSSGGGGDGGGLSASASGRSVIPVSSSANASGGSKLEETWWVMTEDMPTPTLSGVAHPGSSAAVAGVRRGSASMGGGGIGGSGAAAAGSAGASAQPKGTFSKAQRKMLPEGKEGEGKFRASDGATSKTAAGLGDVGYGGGDGAAGGEGTGTSPSLGLRGKRLERRRLYDSPEVSKLEAQMRSPAKVCKATACSTPTPMPTPTPTMVDDAMGDNAIVDDAIIDGGDKYVPWYFMVWYRDFLTSLCSPLR